MTDEPDPYATPAPGSTPAEQPPPYGQPPAGQPPYGQPPYGQPQYGQPPYGQSPYASPPAYGTDAWGVATGGNYASWGRRVGGRLIDAIIVIVPSAIIGGVAGSRGAYDLVALILGLGIGYLNGAQGQSPGKRVVGVRLVRARDGQLLGGGMGVVREFAHLLDSFSLLIGWFWPLWDAKKQTFADKVCGTVVVTV